MPDLSSFPSTEIRFDRQARVIGGADAVAGLVGDHALTDLLVLVHGWNNDEHGAFHLYRALTSSLRTVVDSDAFPALANRRIGAVAVFWPSIALTGLGREPDPGLIRDQIQGLRPVFPDSSSQRTLDAAAALVPRLPAVADARAGFADELRSLLVPTAMAPEDVPPDLFELAGPDLMDRLSVPASLTSSEGTALVGGAWGAAQNLVNFTTYFAMKRRAGEIGELGLAPVLAAAPSGVRVHLVGHSFGARLVAAASKALPADAVTTLALLQAAFSHHGFAEDFEPGQHGYFRTVISDKKVTGPVLVTHTENDLAVGIAYALASRISGNAAGFVGDVDDRYGGMGRNGARRTPEAVPAALLPVGSSYAWQPRRPHNLLADDFIKGHTDITGAEVAYALCAAVAGV